MKTSSTFTQSWITTGLCFFSSDHTSYWLLYVLKKVRCAFHLSQDFPLPPWDTLTQNLTLNNLVKPTPSLVCNVYQRGSPLSLGPKQPPLSESAALSFWVHSRKNTHMWPHFILVNTAVLSLEMKYHERIENIGLQLSLKVTLPHWQTG